MVNVNNYTVKHQLKGRTSRMGCRLLDGHENLDGHEILNQSYILKLDGHENLKIQRHPWTTRKYYSRDGCGAFDNGRVLEA